MRDVKSFKEITLFSVRLSQGNVKCMQETQNVYFFVSLFISILIHHQREQLNDHTEMIVTTISLKRQRNRPTKTKQKKPDYICQKSNIDPKS